MVNRDTDGREPTIQEILNNHLQNQAYRNEGALNPSRNSDGRSESLQQIIDAALLEQAYRNDSR